MYLYILGGLHTGCVPVSEASPLTSTPSAPKGVSWISVSSGVLDSSSKGVVSVWEHYTHSHSHECTTASAVR